MVHSKTLQAPAIAPAMTKEELDKPLKISVSTDIAQRLVGKNISEVIPDAASLARALAKVPKERRTSTSQAIDKEYLRSLFDSQKKWMTQPSVAVMFLDLVRQQLLSVNECIKTQKDLVTFLNLLTASKQKWRQIWELLPEATRQQFFSGKGTLSSFLQQFNGDANLFVYLFTDLNALRGNYPGNLTGNLGNMRECLSKITVYHLRILLIKSLATHPNYLDDFNDEQLASVLGELTNPQDLANILSKCADRLQERPSVIHMLVQHRMNDMDIATVLIEKYVGLIPANQWIEHWQVIANHLAVTMNSSSLFLQFDKQTLKTILDSYERLVNLIRPIVNKQQGYQRWVNLLLLPQTAWSFFAKSVEHSHQNSQNDPSLFEIESGLEAVGILFFLLPTVFIVSVLGLIPALVAGAINLAKIKPAQNEINELLKEHPNIKAEDFIKGYERHIKYHQTLTQESQKLSFFSNSTSKESRLFLSDDLDPKSPYSGKR